MAYQAQAVYAATINAAGAATVTIRTNGFQTWRVQQIALNVPGASGLASLKKNGIQISPMIANNGVADGDPSIELLPAHTMTVEWTGQTVGLTGTVTVIYEVGS